LEEGSSGTRAAGTRLASLSLSLTADGFNETDMPHPRTPHVAVMSMGVVCRASVSPSATGTSGAPQDAARQPAS